MMVESFIFSPFTIFALFIFCLFLYKRLLQSTKANLPPSPPRLPVIGNLHQLTSCPHRGLFALSRKFGDTMLLHLGSKPVLVVSSATSARHIMKTHDVAFASRPQSGVFHHVLYDGRDVAAAPYGEYWRQIRSVCVLQLLSNSRVKSYRDVRKEEISLMIEKLTSHLGKEVNLSELFFNLLNDIVCRATFGKKYGEKSLFKKLLHEFEVLVGGFYIKDFIPWLGWINRVSGLDARVKRIREDLDEFLEEAVKEHEDRVGFNHGKGAKNFLDVLLEVQRNEATGFPLERDSIKAILLTKKNNNVKPSANVIWMVQHTHCNDKGELEWADGTRSKEIHDKLKDVASALDSMTQEEILVQVLDSRSAYIRGKGTTLRSYSREKQVEQRKLVEKQQEKIQEQEHRIKELEDSQRKQQQELEDNQRKQQELENTKYNNKKLWIP